MSKVIGSKSGQETDASKLKLDRLNKLTQLKEMGVNPYPYRFDRTHKAAELQTIYKDLANGTHTEDLVKVCGKVMSVRNSWMFVDLFDDSGKIQLFSHKDNMPEDKLKSLKLLDKGDYIGVEGKVRRTDKGELSIAVTDVTVLCKSLLPLPDSWEGFTDVEARYRHRYVDMIMNPDVRERLRKRSLTIRHMRNFLDDHGYLEVETPTLQVEAGGADARPFVTHHNALDLELYLRIATELHLKRMIIGGMERVYEIGRIFRNEGISTRHNPEFTMLEMYCAYGDYNELMDFTEAMLRYIAEKVLGQADFQYQGESISFDKPFRRLRMVDAIKEATGVDVSGVKDFAEAKKVAESLGVKLEHEDSRGAVINAIFEAKAEHTLMQPTFIMDHPLEISPLTKIHRNDPLSVERFELFIYGRELANGYSELSDPQDQRKRLEDQAAKKAAGNEEAMPLDLDFIMAMEYGMPPTMGIGIGIDRLVMLLTDAASIRDVIAFPTMKPLPQPKKPNEPK